MINPKARLAATCLGVGGTWDFDQKEGWTHPGSPLGELLSFVCKAGPILVEQHDDYWNHHEEGLLAETLWQRIRGRSNFPAWEEGGGRLAEALLKACARDVTRPWPLLIISHSHGAQVVAWALSELLMQSGWKAEVSAKGVVCEWQPEVFWLAIDPPVRRELALVYNAAHQSLDLRSPWVHGPHMIQTRSNAKNWKSWPRWAGGQRWPWDASRLVEGETDVPFVAQPGGHSDVLLKPRRYTEWWRGVINRFSFGSGWIKVEGQEREQ